MRTDQLALPVYAPLSAPLLTHVLEISWTSGPAGLMTEDDHRHIVRRAVAQTRPQVLATLAPLVLARRLTSGMFLDLFAQIAPPAPSGQTLARWRERGVIRFLGYGQPDPHSAASALLVRHLIPRRQRGWLPEAIGRDEPLWWCWRQDGPEEAPQLCPVPLPQDLPAGTLLWTPWRGAMWDGGWTVFAGGAARWAGTPTISTIARWSPLLPEQVGHLVRELDSDAVVSGMVASHVLAQLAAERLSIERVPI